MPRRRYLSKLAVTIGGFGFLVKVVLEWRVGGTYVFSMARARLRLKPSTSIAAAAYDRRRQTLRVTFKPGKGSHGGSTYEYLGIPEDVVQQFLQASSLGQFVNWRIKPYYQYNKVS